MKLTLCEKCVQAIRDAGGTAHVAFDVTPDGVRIIIDGKPQPPHPHPQDRTFSLSSKQETKLDKPE